MPHALVEVGARLEFAVLQELAGRTVKLVGAGPDAHIGHGADSAAQLRIVVSRRDVHGLNRLDRGNQDLQQPGPLIVIDALNLIAVAHPRCPVYFGLDGTCGVEKLRVLVDRRPDSRHESK